MSDLVYIRHKAQHLLSPYQMVLVAQLAGPGTGGTAAAWPAPAAQRATPRWRWPGGRHCACAGPGDGQCAGGRGSSGGGAGGAPPAARVPRTPSHRLYCNYCCCRYIHKCCCSIDNTIICVSCVHCKYDAATVTLQQICSGRTRL